MIEHIFGVWKKQIENFINYSRLYLQNTSSNCNYINDTT
jgi:hypothetical protein